MSVNIELRKKRIQNWVAAKAFLEWIGNSWYKMSFGKMNTPIDIMETKKVKIRTVLL